MRVPTHRKTGTHCAAETLALEPQDSGTPVPHKAGWFKSNVLVTKV